MRRRFKGWRLDREYRDLIGCDCKPLSPCGCDADQRAWTFNEPGTNFEDEGWIGGVECLGCGAAWISDENFEFIADLL